MDKGEQTTWDDLCGPCTLSSVRTDVTHPFDTNASGIAFELDTPDQCRTVFVFEDPRDGYRSCATEPMVVRAPMYSFGCDPEYIRAPVLVQRWTDSDYGSSADGIELIDIRNGKVVLTVGTDNSDDYYPSYTANWQPQNLAENS